MQIYKDLVQVLIHDHGGFHDVLGFTPLIVGRLQHVLEENMATTLVLNIPEILSTHMLLLGQLVEVAHILQSHIILAEIEAQREIELMPTAGEGAVVV